MTETRCRAQPSNATRTREQTNAVVIEEIGDTDDEEYYEEPKF